MKKLNLILIIICALTFNRISFAQSAWNFFYSVPTTNNYTCTKFINANTGFITGECGTILRTTNSGTNWNFIENYTNYTFSSIFPINSSILYSLTINTHSPDHGSKIFKSTNSGVNWLIIKQVSNILRTIYFLDENNGYAAGDDGVLLYTSDGGFNWADRSPGTSASLQNIQFLNAQTGYISSISYQGIFFKTTNGGLNWNGININSNSYYTSFYFKDANTGIVCGGSITYVPPPPFPGHYEYQEKIFKTTNGGINWTTFLFGTAGIFRTLCTYNNNVFVFGEGSSKKSTDFGTTWSNLEYAINPTPRFSFMIDSTEGFIVGDYGRIAKFMGNSYPEYQNVSLSPYTVYSIHFTNVNTGFLLTTDPSLTGNSQIYKTTNSGVNWIYSYYSNYGYFNNNINFANSNCGVACGERELLLTSNAGATWIYKWYPTTLDINKACILPNNRAIAVGDSGLIVQSDNFGSWYSYQLYNLGNFIDITFPSANTGYILTDSNKIIKSTNSGDSWNALTLPINKLNSFYFINANTGFISANIGATIYKTTNGGWNWNSIYSGSGKTFKKLYFIDSLKGFGFNDLNYNVEFTLNGGISWTPILLHCSNLPICINFANQSTGFLGGLYGTIFRTTNGGTIWAGNIGTTLPSSFSLSQNYPNPFNPTTSIKYNVASSKHIKLVVYNILGKEIATLVNEKQSPGTYEVNWDASAFPSGVYFYKLTAGDYTETKKALLIK